MHLFAFSAYMDTEQRDACCNFILSSRERKEPRGDAAAATVCGPVPSPLASPPVVTRSGVRLFNRSPVFVGS